MFVGRLTHNKRDTLTFFDSESRTSTVWVSGVDNSPSRHWVWVRTNVSGDKNVMWCPKGKVGGERQVIFFFLHGTLNE